MTRVTFLSILLFFTPLFLSAQPAWQQPYGFFPPSCCVMGQTVDLRDLRGQRYTFTLTPPAGKIFLLSVRSSRIMIPGAKWNYNLSFSRGLGGITVMILPVSSGMIPDPSVMFTPDYGAGGVIGISYFVNVAQQYWGQVQDTSGFIRIGSQKDK